MAPPRTNDVYILMSLVEGPLHGYRIGQWIEQASDGAVRLEAGNLHRTVQKLIRQGLVEVTDVAPDPTDDDPRRRYYAITAAGRDTLADETVRLRSLVEQLEARDSRTGGGT